MKENNTVTGMEIAVIGMSGRFPGAKNIDEFWNNLINKVESVTFFSDMELEEVGLEADLLKNPVYVKAKGVLQDIEYFDSTFFNFTPREAEMIDPQLRIFLECAWEALENAAYNPDSYDGLIGLYAGNAANYFWVIKTIFDQKANLLGQVNSRLLSTHFSTRVSYHLNLKGPSLTIQTACSTSLVTIHEACLGILSGECNIALAGGASVILPQKSGYLYQEGMIVSPDGHCRTFDARAKGSVFGNGVGVVVLKRLDDALADGDFIYAVVKGTAINNDGIRKVGYTAPSVEGQADVLKAAYLAAEVDPDSIGFIETHGTGTELGDPIEIEALRMVFYSKENKRKKNSCALGSVKSNVGHLNIASGVTGFIKTVLALNHRLIPPSLNFETPNPKIDFENSPFYVNTRLKVWENNGCPLRAGVSSFGLGGTNAHVILEAAPGTDARGQGQGRGGVSPPGQSRDYQLILLSAQTETALDCMTRNLVEYFQHHLLNQNNHENPINHGQHPGLTLPDAAYTLQVGRKAFKYRKMLVSTQVKETCDILSSSQELSASAPASGKVYSSVLKVERPGIVFMFPGLGSQYVNMGREIYEKEPYFRREMDRCFKILQPLTGYNIKEILYPSFKSEKSDKSDIFDRSDQSDRSDTSDNPDLHQPGIAQIVIFIIQYALARLLLHWGITPRAMIGYSFGEYTAACISGVFSLEDMLKLIVTRGQLIRRQPAGIMLSVPAPVEQIEPLIPGGLSIAIDNGSSCIVSGPTAAMEIFEAEMKKKRVMCMRLNASHPLHSAMMAPALREFNTALAALTGHKPQIPYISNVTGNWITVEQALDPSYWATHLTGTVQFARGLRELTREPGCIFIDIGPGRDLLALLRRYMAENLHHRAIDLIRVRDREINDSYYLLHRVGQLWLYGVEIDWTSFYEKETRRRIPLPVYPFDRKRFEVEKEIHRGIKTQLAAGVPLKKTRISDWFYIPQWTRSALTPGQYKENTRQPYCLFFTNQTSLASRLENRLKQEKTIIITVRASSGFKKISGLGYTINPQNSRDYHELVRELITLDRFPAKILHCWNVTGKEHEAFNGDEWSCSRASQHLGFFSFLYLVKAIGSHGVDKDIQIDIISNQLQEVTGSETICPAKATYSGLVKVIPQEYPNILCRSIDIRFPLHGAGKEKELTRRLCLELAVKPSDPVVAYRNNYRWIQTFEPVRWEQPVTGIPRLRKNGVYLVTGGLGNIGFSLAEYLAEGFGAKLILTGRREIPPENQRQQWLDTHESHDPLSVKISRIKKLQDKGGQVLAFGVDVQDEQGMQKVLRQAEKKFGPINGVIHAAGETKSVINPLRLLSDTQCHRQFEPKVHGLLVLAKLFQNKELDFGLLISSLSPVLGGLGFAAYSAANCFMDAFVHRYNRSGTVKWISVNWGDWKFLKQDTKREKTRIRSTIAQFEMTPDEGIQTFQRILFHCQTHQVVVSAGDLHARINQWVKLESRQEEDIENNRQPSLLHARPDLINPYLAPRHQVEQDIAVIWQQLFGFDRVGIHDDFFELGGDSLKAVTVISRIHQKSHVLLPLDEFFKRPDIESLARYITQTVKVEYRSIEPVEKKEYYQLSSPQKRLFILQQIEKNSTAYNEPQVLITTGIPDRESLARTYGMLIQRHESLRTSFHLVGNQPVQRIHDKVEFSIEYHNPTTGDRGQATADKKATHPSSFIRHQSSEFIRPFDLSRAPIFRVGLIRIPGQGAPSLTAGDTPTHILIVDLHHIVTDGTSNQILVKEFLSLHQGKALAGLKIHYKDYSEWLTGEPRQLTQKKQEKYWLKVFEGELPLLALPTDYPRPAQQDFKGKTIGFQIENEEIQALKNLLAKEDVTLYMILLTIFYIFFFKITGQEDIIIGSPTAGRRHSDLEHIIGMFVNTLPLRNFPNAGKHVSHFLREVKENTIKDFENQEYPFEELIDQLEIRRDISRNPVFDVVFVLQNLGTGKTGETGTQRTIKPYRYQPGIAKFDLSLHALESGENLAFRIEYCVKLFRDETIERFICYLKRIISSIIIDPHQGLGEIEILSEAEKNQLLIDFNDTTAGYPKDKTIHQLFQEQVKRTPDQLALVGDEEEGGMGRRVEGKSISVTYRELHERSRRLAYLLLEKGVQPNSIVGIMMERSLEIFIGFLGIMKAGCAYLPIDPRYPEERIHFMLKDSSTKVLLAAPGTRVKQLPLQLINIETGLAPSFDSAPSTLTSTCQVNSTNLAYIIYTSGSTGKPKGVLVRHQGFINLIYFHQKVFGQDQGTRMSQVASQGFDAMALEAWPCLAWGAALFIAAKEIRLDPVKMKNWIIKNKINISFQSTVMAEQLLTVQWPEQGVELRALLTGGDRLKRNPTRKFPFQLYNLYGPTEDTVLTTWTKVEVKGNSDNDLHQNPGIGKPIGNHRVYIFGPHGELQPVGVPGELCIAGIGLARGYLNRPELTAEKFDHDLWDFQDYHDKKLLRGVQGGGFLEKSPPGSRRLYRTGDLARWLPDGSIDFVGRIDNQVKIRGYRIELGEIESLILKHNQIKDAAVLAGEKGNNDKYLCAYFVAENQLAISTLKTHLARHLPGYMIPAYFVQLDKIPLTPNGKVDRRALPEPGIESSEDDIKPNTEIEKMIAETWREVLGLDIIGVHTRFFDIGGNSLNILQVQSKLKDAIKTDVPLMVIFQYPTIYSLAGYISSEGIGGNNIEFLPSEKLDLDKNMMKQSLQKLGANLYRQSPADDLEDQPIGGMEPELKEKE